MRRVIIVILFALILTGCSDRKNVNEASNVDSAVSDQQAATPTALPTVSPTATTAPTSTPTPTAEVIDTSEIQTSDIPFMYSNPDDYLYRSVKLTGKVFTAPEYDTDGVYFQMFQDYENSENNTIVFYADNTFEIKPDDYVSISGLVAGTYNGTNAFGGNIVAPTIVCESIDILSYAEIVAPAIATKELNQSIIQNGYEVILEKVEFAEKETRIYITVNNAGKANFNLYDFNAKVVQDKTQYESEDNWAAGYPEIQTDLMPEVTSSGIICFPALDSDSSMTVYLDGYSDNYREDFELYTYKVE